MSKAIKDLDSFLETMRECFLTAEESLVDLHADALEDFRFRTGGDAQWDPQTLQRRRADGRPSFSINRIPQFLRQVTGEQKKNRPAIEISPLGDGADLETAEIEQGLVRHIERSSNAEDAYDTAFDHMATGGFGFIRLLADYVNGKSFEQEIKFQRELNPFAHYPDPRCKEADYSDAKWWFVIETVSKKDFEADYPGTSIAGVDFGALADRAPGWLERDSVRIAEYYWIESATKTLVRLRDGSTKYKDELKKGDGPAIAEREAEVKTVYWCKTNGVEILEGPTEIPGEYIPIVPVLGEEIRVEGRRHLVGLVRYAREPQRLYNLWQSSMAETIALAPKAPFIATTAQVEGYEEIWDDAHNGSYSYLPYNADPKAPGPPQRQFAEPPIQAISAALAHADNDLKSTTGLYDPSLGAPGPEQSGKAILLRQKQGDTASYGFIDSMGKAIKHLGRIIIGWIPRYYDTARVVRIVNPDGTSDVIPINQAFQDGAVQKIYDLTVGEYDVAVKSGPSYESAREEAAQSILSLVQAQPELMQVVGDLLVKCFDWPMATEISERLHKMLPAPLQDNADQQQVPPQAQAKMAQQDQMLQAMTQSIHALSAKLEAQQVQAASRERVALIQAKAMIEAAALKAKSQEAIVAFEQDLQQIDRQLQLIPDPAMDQEAAMQQGQQQHEQTMQSAQQAHEIAMSKLGASQQAGMQQGQQAHEQNMSQLAATQQQQQMQLQQRMQPKPKPGQQK